MTDLTKSCLRYIRTLIKELNKPTVSTEVVDNASSALSKRIDIASSMEEFYDIPYKNVCKIIKNVDFSTVENNVHVIKTLICKFQEKFNFTSIILLGIISCKTCMFTMEDLIEIFQCFKTSQLLEKLCNIYNEYQKLPSIDYEYEIERRERKIKELKEFGEEFDTPVSTPPLDFEPNIHKAAEYGKLSSVRYLIETKNANIFAKTNKKKNYPLHFACLNGHLNVIQYLINYAKNHQFFRNLPIIEMPNKDGISPLDNVISKGYIHIIQYLCNLIYMQYVKMYYHLHCNN